MLALEREEGRQEVERLGSVARHLDAVGDLRLRQRPQREPRSVSLSSTGSSPRMATDTLGVEHQRVQHRRDAYSWSGSLAGGGSTGSAGGGALVVVGVPLAPPVPAPAEVGMPAPPIVGGAPGSGFTFPGVGTGSPP